MKITFVCLGNICRSPMAEFIAKNIINQKGLKNFIIDSCGTSGYHDGEGMHPGTKKILNKYSIPSNGFISKKITNQIFDSSDFVVVMDNSNYNNIVNMFGDNKKIIKICKYSNNYSQVPDPWYTNNFQEV